MSEGKSRLSKLRQGIPPHKAVILNGVKFEVVVLPIDIIRQCEEMTEEYANANKSKVNDSVKEQYYNALVAYHCLRDPDDPLLQAKASESPEEISKTLDGEDISRILSAYGELMINKAPKIEFLSEEQFDEIKKYLEVTPLSDLNTVLLVHLMNFHQAMPFEE